MVASDDGGELWFGSSDASAQVVATVPGWTSPRQWDKFKEQTSAPQTLRAGVYYFIRALANEGGGGDNLAVGL